MSRCLLTYILFAIILNCYNAIYDISSIPDHNIYPSKVPLVHIYSTSSKTLTKTIFGATTLCGAYLFGKKLLKLHDTQVSIGKDMESIVKDHKDLWRIVNVMYNSSDDRIHNMKNIFEQRLSNIDMNIINIGDSFDNLFLQIERLNVNLSDVLNRIQNVESDVTNSSMTSLLEEQIITLNSSYTELSTLVKNLELDIDTIKDYENKVMIKLKSFGDKLQEILRLRTDD